MKIIVDKIDVPPPHALSREDINALLRLVKGWSLILFDTVHLRAMTPSNARKFTSYRFTRHGYCLSVYCRGITPHEARRKILRTLAIESLGTSGRLSDNQEHKVNEIVEVTMEAAEAEVKGREIVTDTNTSAA